ncbi:MAG: hypothetical protein J6K38_02975 [Alistipes sp.]|nr:hypothetical protein [Alistipes sp.]
MKKISVLILLLFSCVLFAESASAQTKTVAVYVEGKIGNDDKSIVTSAVLARMSGNKEYAPFERNEAFIDALTHEQDYQLSGEVPEKEIREVGGRLGVDYVVAVNVVIKDNETCYMSARLINLETGAIVKTANQHRQYTDSSVLTALANNVAYRLLNKQSK